MAVDLTPTPITPAVVSYTPLDLSGVKGMLDAKVQQVETGAGAAREFLSTLDFKEGPFSRGNAEMLTKKYTQNIKELIDNLYSTGDTRAFSSDLAQVATAVKMDPLALASLDDYNQYQDHLKRQSNPQFATYDFLYTDDKTSTGDIVLPEDYDPTQLTPDKVSTLYGIVPPANIQKDYTEKFKTLARNKYEQFVGRDENGFLIMRTTDETRELPIELQQEVEEILSRPGATAYTLVAEGLRSISPEVYNTLANDYDGQDTETMVNFAKSLGLSKEEAIGRVIENTMPYLNPSSTTLQSPPRTGGTGSGDQGAPEQVEANTIAFATNIAGPQDTEAIEDVLNLINLGDSNVGQFSELLGSDDEKERNIGAYAFALINNMMKQGDPAHEGFTPEFFADIEAKAKEEQIAIINRYSSFEPRYGIPGVEQETWLNTHILNNPNAANALKELQRLRNTLGYLGVSHLGQFSNGDRADREALVQEALDQYDNLLDSQNQGIVQQLTNGVGILTRAELEELLSPYGNSDGTTTAVASIVTQRLALNQGMQILGEYPMDGKVVAVQSAQGFGATSVVSAMMSGISQISNTTIDATGEKRSHSPRDRHYASASDMELRAMAESSPTAFLELAKRDYATRAQLYYTDLLITPGTQQRDVVTQNSYTDAINFAAQGADFFTRWDILEVKQTPAEGTDGIGQGASVRISGGEISSAYAEIEDKNTKNSILTEFGKWGAEAGKTDNTTKEPGFIFNGIIYPNGQMSETGLLFTRIKGNTTQKFVFQPKDLGALSMSETYGSMSLTQKTLAGKRYAAIITAGDAFEGRYVATLSKELEDDADMYQITSDYIWTDTKAQLDGTRNNKVSPKIGESTADNIYFSGNSSVVLDISNGEQIFKIKNKDNTDVTWEDYFNSISGNINESQFHIGTSDYEYLLGSMVRNQEMLQARGLDVTEDTVRNLLQSTEMGTIQDLVAHFGASSLSDITRGLPIVFGDGRAAYRHFSGQSANATDRFGNPTAGFFPKR